MQSLTKTISKSVFGSAVAGFGFSLGNDLYKTTKGKNGSSALIMILVVVALFGAYSGGLFVTRNYKNWFLSLLMVFIGVGLATISAGFLIAISGALGLAVVGGGISASIFLIGLLVGLVQRRKRKQAWISELKNEEFLDRNGFQTQDGFIFGPKGQKYRVENQTPKHIELFAIGRRSRRGFLRLDENGTITSWSGMVKV